jgi:acetolactate synthase I/II/III large subunit
MNGANALIRTLVDAGVDVCFTNPGTSEMHFVAALDDVPGMRGVLALFEGVATGAADGYARMARRPAAVLLHLGPGLGNGLANLHNARRAGTPIVNIVGDHALPHKELDAPLESDIETVARNVSSWVRTSASTAELGRDAAEAVAAAIGAPGQVSTLILPADVSWNEGGEVAARRTPPVTPRSATDTIRSVAEALRSGRARAHPARWRRARRRRRHRRGRHHRGSTGADILTEVFPTRLARGQGVAPLERLGYLSEASSQQLAGKAHLILVGAEEPVTFFAYPEKPSQLVPDDTEVQVLAGAADDAAGALDALAAELGCADEPPPRPTGDRAERPTGELNAWTVSLAVGALLPEDAIVVDEAITSSLSLPMTTANAPEARLAHPHRRVHRLRAARGRRRRGRRARPQGAGAAGRRFGDVHPAGAVDDGPRGARRHRRHLQQRLVRDPQDGAAARRRRGDGPEGRRPVRPRSAPPRLLRPGRGMGVEATRATTAEEFTEQLEAALATPGPSWSRR